MSIKITSSQQWSVNGTNYTTYDDALVAAIALGELSPNQPITILPPGVRTLIYQGTCAPTPPALKAAFTAVVTGMVASVTDATTNPGGTTSEHWDWGDGQSDDTIGKQAHTYAAAGTYTITLTAKDAKTGITSQATQSVSIAQQAPPPPSGNRPPEDTLTGTQLSTGAQP